MYGFGTKHKYNTSIFRKKGLSSTFSLNPSKFIEKDNSHSFFCFSFQATLSFTLQILKPILIFLKSGKLSTESGAPERTKKCESALKVRSKTATSFT